MTVSTGEIQTLPSPIWPVRAASTMASAYASRVVVVDEHLDAHLGHVLHRVLGAAVHLGVAPLAAETSGLGDRDAGEPELCRAPP